MILLRHHCRGLTPALPAPRDLRPYLPPGDSEYEAIQGPGQLPGDHEQWRSALIDQAKRAIELKQRFEEGTTVHYFGLTWEPLAVDLGLRLGSWVKVQPYLRHHDDKDWSWRDPVGQAPIVEGLPDGPELSRGSVTVRVSASYLVTPEQTGMVTATPVAEIDLRCRVIQEDPFGTQQELEDFVEAWRQLMNDITRLYPKATRVDLFVAGPVAMCLLMGAALNPRIHLPIHCWQYERAKGGYTLPVPIGLTLEQLTMKTRILVITSSPDNHQRLATGPEVRDSFDQRLLTEALHRDRFEVIHKHALLAEDFQAVLGREKPQVLHFSGHGTPTGELVFHRRHRTAREASKDVGFEFISRAVALTAEDTPYRLAVINACHSDGLAELLVKNGVQSAIGMHGKVADDVAIAFAKELYRALGDGESVGKAFDLACNALAFADVHDRTQGEPALFVANGIGARSVRLFD